MKRLHLLVVLVLLTLPVKALAGSVNIATGSMYQEFELFEVKSAGLPSALTIYYKSLKAYESVLGKSWTHSFDAKMRDRGYQSLVQKDFYSNSYLFSLTEGKYQPQTGDHATLVKEKDGGYTIKRNNLTYRYDKDLKLTAVTDETGAVTTFIFSGDNVKKIVTSKKDVITFDYGNSGRLARIIDATGRSYSFGYDDNGNLATVSYPDATALRFTSDARGLMLTKTERNGKFVTFRYDKKGRVIDCVIQGGETFTYSYPDHDGPVKTATSTAGNEVTNVTYDTRTGTVPKVVDSNGGVTTYTYDAHKNVTSETDPAGRTTYYTYDEKDRRTGLRDPDGNLTSYQYSDNGKLQSVTDSRFGTERYFYDVKGQLTKSIGPDGKSLTYVYDREGSLTAIVGPDGETVPVGGSGTGH